MSCYFRHYKHTLNLFSQIVVHVKTRFQKISMLKTVFNVINVSKILNFKKYFSSSTSNYKNALALLSKQIKEYI